MWASSGRSGLPNSDENKELDEEEQLEARSSGGPSSLSPSRALSEPSTRSSPSKGLESPGSALNGQRRSAMADAKDGDKKWSVLFVCLGALPSFPPATDRTLIVGCVCREHLPFSDGRSCLQGDREAPRTAGTLSEDRKRRHSRVCFFIRREGRPNDDGPQVSHRRRAGREVSDRLLKRKRATESYRRTVATCRKHKVPVDSLAQQVSTQDCPPSPLTLPSCSR